MKLFIFIIFIFTVITTQARVRIMSYNVENLFDTIHDSGKEDFSFTALGTPGRDEYCLTVDERYRQECLEQDWNSEKLLVKLAQIDKVVHAAKNIDILVLVEVENENVVSMLAKKLGFKKFIMTNSPDKRGIDVAVLYHESKALEFIKSHEYEMKGEVFKNKPTRNVLEGIFKYQGEKLSIFANHWPSQSSPGWVRTLVATQVKKIVDQRISEKHNVIVTGDFNVINNDNPHPFKEVLFKGTTKNRLIDVHSLHLAELKKIDFRLTFKVPFGTYFYGTNMEWNLLDRFFISPSLIDAKKIDIDPMSYQIFAEPFMTGTYTYNSPDSFNFGTTIKNIPFRYDHDATSEALAGYSDHFPIILEIK